MDLVEAIIACSKPDKVVLVDCLTLWASNLMLAERDAAAATQGLVRAVSAAPGPVILVANEVGLGIMPDNGLARRFCDIAGWMNRALAQAADGVAFVAAGLPLVLTGNMRWLCSGVWSVVRTGWSLRAISNVV